MNISSPRDLGIYLKIGDAAALLGVSPWTFRHWGHGSNAGHSSGVAGVDAGRATPPDPRLARWGLARCCQLDPSYPALLTRADPGVEP